MSTQRTVMVELPARAYPVTIGGGALGGAASAALGRLAAKSVLLAVDANVARLHRDKIAQAFPGIELTIIPAGEDSKTLAMAQTLYAELGRRRIGRDGIVVAVGGGVIGDLAGFVAGTWMRGISFFQAPTTIEAAIDAAVGGKTGVNTEHGKNMVGVFHQPVGVVVDTDFFATLPDRDVRVGLAESVKHAAIRDPELLGWQEGNVDALLRLDAGPMTELVARNVAIKADVVRRDEREAGLREILNYGHTIGHAIEHLMTYELRHGECVALGMIVENAISVARGWLPAAGAERIRRLLASLGLPTRLTRPLAAAQIWAACQHDKKNRAGAVRMVILREIGAPTAIGDATQEEVALAVEEIKPET